VGCKNTQGVMHVYCFDQNLENLTNMLYQDEDDLTDEQIKALGSIDSSLNKSEQLIIPYYLRYNAILDSQYFIGDFFDSENLTSQKPIDIESSFTSY
jgi:hypothetical protein